MDNNLKLFLEDILKDYIPKNKKDINHLEYLQKNIPHYVNSLFGDKGYVRINSKDYGSITLKFITINSKDIKSIHTHHYMYIRILVRKRRIYCSRDLIYYDNPKFYLENSREGLELEQLID